MQRMSLISLLLGVGAACLVLGAPGVVNGKPYKGGELYSSQAYHYGRMEMRMRMARGSGLLSTFFTYKNGSEVDDTFWEEIDIEVLGKDNATAWQSNIITGLGSRTTSEEVHPHPFSLADDYHTYALEWAPDYVAWELDGVELRRTTGAQVNDLTNPQSLRFNIWAANIAEWVGPFDESALPAYQYVNWIGYYRYEGGQFIHEWTDDFDTFDSTRWARADWTFGENLADFDPANVVVQDGTLILALTREGQTGFRGTVPPDTQGNTGGTGGAGGPGTGGAGDGVGGSAMGGIGGSDVGGVGGSAMGGIGGTGVGGSSMGGLGGSDVGGVGGSDVGSVGGGSVQSGGSGFGGSGVGGDTGSGGSGLSAGGNPSSLGGGPSGGTMGSGGASIGGSGPVGGLGSGGYPLSVGGGVAAEGLGGASAAGACDGPCAPPSLESDDGSGCGCRLGTQQSDVPVGWWLVALGSLGLMRRRMRAAAAGCRAARCVKQALARPGSTAEPR